MAVAELLLQHIDLQLVGSGATWSQNAEPRVSEQEFVELSTSWRNETAFVSDSFEIESHPAYLRIIRMGEPAIPWILRDLQARGGHWFAALNAILGDRESPVQADDVGFPARMRDAWLDWGRTRGYID